MEKEIWKDIEGYEGLYKCSNLGRIKSLNYNHTKEEKILKPTKNNLGYLRVCLCKEGKKKIYLAHRLVAIAFIPNPDNLPQVNHKSEVKTENCVDNLEWCSAEYNINYGTHNQRVGKANSISQKGKVLSQEHKDKIGKAHKGKIVSQETKEKISKAMKGRKPSQECTEKRVKAMSKPVLQLTKEGVFIKQWESTAQASKELNINKGNISNCCNGRYKTCGGFIFKYLNE